MTKNPRIFFPAFAAAIAGIVSEWFLSSRGLASVRFFADLNVHGSQAFTEYASSIVAIGLRIFWTLPAMAGAIALAGGRLRRNGAHVAGVLALLVLIGLASAALVVPTFGISLILFAVFSLYALPAAAFSGCSATDAVVESMRVAAKTFAWSAGIVLIVLAAAVAGGLLGLLVPGVPMLGRVASWVSLEGVAAYAAAAAAAVYLREQSLC